MERSCPQLLLGEKRLTNEETNSVCSSCCQLIDFIIGSPTNGNHINNDLFVYNLTDEAVAVFEKLDFIKACQVTMKFIPRGARVPD
jgi:hypothetical protein